MLGLHSWFGFQFHHLLHSGIQKYGYKEAKDIFGCLAERSFFKKMIGSFSPTWCPTDLKLGNRGQFGAPPNNKGTDNLEEVQRRVSEEDDWVGM